MLDDASAPDLGQLTRVLRKAVSAGTALLRAHKGFWATEFSCDSNPPNLEAIPVTRRRAGFQNPNVDTFEPSP